MISNSSLYMWSRKIKVMSRKLLQFKLSHWLVLIGEHMRCWAAWKISIQIRLPERSNRHVVFHSGKKSVRFGKILALSSITSPIRQSRAIRYLRRWNNRSTELFHCKKFQFGLWNHGECLVNNLSPIKLAKTVNSLGSYAWCEFVHLVEKSWHTINNKCN